MISNTLDDFLKTGVKDQPAITCPACGSIMGLTVSGSYKMVLTDNSRQQVVRIIDSYRNAIRSVETILAQRNAYGIHRVELSAYPHIEEEGASHPHLLKTGEYDTAGAKGVDAFSDALDRLHWFRKLNELPAHSKSVHFDSNQQKSTKIRDILLAGFEPASAIGPLIDLMLCQKQIDAWTEKMLDVSKHKASEELGDLVNNVCPNIGQYLQDILALDDAKAASGTAAKLDLTLKEAVLRCQYIIALLLGHNSPEAIQKSHGFIKPNIPYTLPRLTVVAPNILANILKSEVIVGAPGFKWSPEFRSAVRKGVLNDEQAPTDEKQIVNRVVELLGKEISILVHFACTGPLGYTSYVKEADHDKNKEGGDKKEVSASCNWYPKLQSTHPVVLIGSPGSGKSAVMLTGFTTFYSNAASIGASIAFDAPEDESLMKDYDARYWAGAKPPPTPVHHRLSIKLSVITPSKPSLPTYFVFTDVPGQIASRSLTEAGSDPIVLGILKNAETILFFFDLSIENTIREKLTQGDEGGAWIHMTKNFERVKNDRPLHKSDGISNGNLESRGEAKINSSEAEVSQLQLLQKLLNDLQLARTTEELKTVNFICVIPKSDLFVQDNNPDKRGNEKQYFFTPLYKFLEKEDILVRSLQHGGESFVGKHSLAGSGSKIMVGDEKSEIPTTNQVDIISSSDRDKIAKQKSLLRGISDKALECLRSIGDAIGDEQDLRPLRQSISDAIHIRLVDMLHNIFDEQNVYFLPVSALGEERDNINQSGTKNPFNQKLSEYVFALPVILASMKVITGKLGESSSSTGRSTPTPPRQ